MKQVCRRLLAVSPVLMASACSGPVYVDRAQDTMVPKEWPNQVEFQVYPAYAQAKPDCIAILPLSYAPERGGKVDPSVGENVRRALYAHLAPQGKLDVELARVDYVTHAIPAEKIAEIGEKLHCSAVMDGTITDYGTDYLGLYSRVAVGADLRLRRTTDGALLWQGRHLAQSHGGTLPLSPISVAMGVIDAAMNASDEQLLRITDDLARRLMSTIPDDVQLALTDPDERSATMLPRKGDDAKAFLDDLEGLPADERRQALIKALEDHRFKDRDGLAVLQALRAEAPDNAEAQLAEGQWWLAEGDYVSALRASERSLSLNDANPQANFLKGRVLLLEGALDEAEPSLLRAVAQDGGNPLYLNAVGSLNSLQGNSDRALAAYRMAIKANPANGFAYYNSAILHYDAGDLQQAADSFYGAALSYVKNGDFGRAEKALAELRSLSGEGVAVDQDADTIEAALAALTRRKS